MPGNEARLLVVGLLCTLAACTPTAAELRQKSDALAATSGMISQQIQGGEFTFAIYERIVDPDAPVRIYIEGDGNAWLTRNQVSPDPTPIDPTALTLAVRDPAPNVVYLARPCQYVSSAACKPKYWTAAQFSEPVIASINESLQRWRGHKIELIGYSGGAAVAVLVAARRSDVISVRTVAGNIDTAAFTQVHNISPLSQSLNPADYAQNLALVPQMHFVGEGDTVVPWAVSDSYKRHLPAINCSAFEWVKDANHYSEWAEQWQQLLELHMPCSKGSEHG